MVYYSGLDSIIESLYLEENFIESIKNSNIIVNPSEKLFPYLYGKVIIINHMFYPIEWIKKLTDKNRVITRLDFSIQGTIYNPYESRLNPRIYPNNESVDSVDESTYDEVEFRYDGENLYYPSPIEFTNYSDGKSLTVLGYLLYQIGYNLIEDTLFKNLDVIKLKNGLII